MKYSHCITILAFYTILIGIGLAQKRNAGRGKVKSNLSAARQKIIRCCGAQSCTRSDAILKTTVINDSTTSAFTPTSRVTNNQATNHAQTIVDTQFSDTIDAPVQPEETTPISNDMNAAPSEQNTPLEITTPVQNETPASSSSPDSTTAVEFLQPSTAQESIQMQTSTQNLPTINGMKTETTSERGMPAIVYVKPTQASTIAPEVYPKCPSTCKRDESLFDLDKSLRDPSDHGFWKTACGDLYVFGKSLANWQQNFDKCCSLGMRPIYFQTADKFKCFNNMIDGFKWPYNTRYWTSGLRISSSKFTFCQTNASVALSFWASGQPNNVNKSENCAQLIISPAYNTAQLADKHCGEISPFACMGPTTPKPACNAPQCPNINCTFNSAYFTFKDGPQMIKYLTKPSMHGQWVSAAGRYFLFSYANDTRTYEKSLEACCSIGLKLISLHQDFTFDQLRNASISGKISPAQFWTSGTDAGCEGNFGYCSSNRLLRKEARWAVGQPDNVNNSQNCLAINVDATGTQLSDENCMNKMRYICEGKSPRSVQTIQKECADLYSLTAKISKLINESSKTLKERCFLKCFGEETGFMKDGKLVQEKILAEFQSLSKGDLDKLTESYSTFEYCTNVTKGMDDCDRAAALMKCGQDNSPELMSSLVVNLENTIKGAYADEAVVMSPNQTSTCPSHKCVVDPDLRATFDSKPNNSSFNSFYGTGKVGKACGKRILGLIMPTALTINGSRFHEAFEICCKFGLRLLILEDFTKQNCLQSQPYVMEFPLGEEGYMIAAYYIAPAVNNTAVICPTRQMLLNETSVRPSNPKASGFFVNIKTSTGIFFLYQTPSTYKILCESN
ncbi:uncharacterized protein LOC132193884 isoform X2 [Neocloeon triangulifer]|uniref:uncharacterized protein LOC132193884 isoform X2 n=1 Tax=Neocloeon triangulifer TaxID=2078957 RepID=UPI00286F7C9A|nr:uncharacterized protein LOC132193884 isoform X2 [Neocloeon triangulifer]